MKLTYVITRPSTELFFSDPTIPGLTALNDEMYSQNFPTDRQLSTDGLTLTVVYTLTPDQLALHDQILLNHNDYIVADRAHRTAVGIKIVRTVTPSDSE